jgi:hypothetical protein
MLLAIASLSQVLRTSLPYDAKYGEILVQEVAKGGNKVLQYFEVLFLESPQGLLE